MPYYLALDAGGTKTQCWIGDEERILGRASTGTVKLMNVGEEVATRRLQDLVISTAESAGVSLAEVRRACMGIAGVSIEAVRVWGESTLQGLIGGDVSLCGDEAIALDAAFRGGPGVLVIAGTGSYIAGRCTDGTYVTAGGWGPVVGDEGSASWIGLWGVRKAFWAYDRGIKTLLLDGIREAWRLKSTGELIAKSNASRRPDFAELSSVVSACADAGDGIAAELLARAGQDLGEQVDLVIRKMIACGCAEGDGSRVAFTGSVVGQVRAVREEMTRYLRNLYPEIQVAERCVEPLEGAMWRARNGIKG